MAQSVSFFDVPYPIKLDDIAQHCDCIIREGDDGSSACSNVGPIEAATEGSLTFLNNSRYIKAIGETRALAVICSASHAENIDRSKIVLISQNPYKSFARAVGMMFPSGLRPQSVTGETGISGAAVVHEATDIGAEVIVEPGAIIGPNVAIGSGSYIGANSIIGANVQVGRNTSICASASVTHAVIGNEVIIHPGVRIGNDGFGFAMGPGGHLKIPQIGRVIIQDHVEIGSNTTVDRGANRDTIIGEGTKIDNLVMIAHNVVIGQHCIIVGQVGIAGSATLGDYVVLGGKCAVNGHVKIGTGAQLAGLSGVSSDVPPGVQWGGVPARPIKHWMREIARLRREASGNSKQGNGSNE